MIRGFELKEYGMGNLYLHCDNLVPKNSFSYVCPKFTKISVLLTIEPRTQLLSAPDVTLTIREDKNKSNNNVSSSSDYSENIEDASKVKSDHDECNEEIYESLNTLNDLDSSKNKSTLKSAKSFESDKEKQAVKKDNLYAKVKKLSNSSDAGPDLNSEFVSIYELTKVRVGNWIFVILT